MAIASKRFLPVIALLLPMALLAEEKESYRYKGSGYGFFTTGACRHSYAIAGGGGGAEGFLWRGLTLGVEGGYEAFIGSFDFGEVYMPLGWHFVDRGKPAQWDPFVSVALIGLNVGHGGGSGAAHFGGGVTYWFKKRVGLRLEFRAHTNTSSEVTGQGRIGIAFR